MPRGKKFTTEQIIGKLREAEVGLAQGKTVPEVVRKRGVTEQTYYRWKREYGNLRTDQAKRRRLWLGEGSCIRLLTIVDEFTRECLAIDVGRKLTSDDVLERPAPESCRPG
jgi:putative transposase